MYYEKDFSVEKPIIIVPIGGPGSGKGSQAKLLRDKLGFHIISMSGILAERAEIPDDISKRISECRSKGTLVPNKIVISELKQHISGLDPTIRNIVFDGFPRDLEQNKVFLDYINSMGDCMVFVFYLYADKDVLLRRILGRAESDKANGNARPDDTLEVADDRLMEFELNTIPIINYYSKCSCVESSYELHFWCINAKTPEGVEKDKNIIFQDIVSKFPLRST